MVCPTIELTIFQYRAAPFHHAALSNYSGTRLAGGSTFSIMLPLFSWRRARAAPSSPRARNLPDNRLEPGISPGGIKREYGKDGFSRVWRVGIWWHRGRVGYYGQPSVTLSHKLYHLIQHFQYAGHHHPTMRFHEPHPTDPSHPVHRERYAACCYGFRHGWC